MNELEDDVSKSSSDSDELKTPTNTSTNNFVKFSLESTNDDSIEDATVSRFADCDQEDQDVTLDENTINSDVFEPSGNELNSCCNENRPNLINSYSHSMPQFPIQANCNYLNPYLHHGTTMCNLNSYFNPTALINYPNINSTNLNQNSEDKESKYFLLELLILLRIYLRDRIAYIKFKY